jgi:A/G-specific adenine glycosylase
VPDFASELVSWQRVHGRHDLPWQASRDAYRIWLSEIMLQQTQVEVVIPYYERVLTRFPDVRSLARASQDEVLRQWSGLGYYARARNLHAAARRVVHQLGGRFPADVESLAALPGIGRSTAAAIAVFAFGRRAAILDGNVKRVLARCFGIEGHPGERPVEQRLWALAERLLPQRSIRSYTQALMDLGATVCTRTAPRCDCCPAERRCVARREGRTGELPAPRPRKLQPERRSTWLVLLHGGRVLLERRPAIGLWGGLWVFPELRGARVRHFCRQALGCEISQARRLEAVEHGFSHFRLRAQPLLCTVSGVAPGVAAPGRKWMVLARAAEAAVPTPVRELIGRLRALGGSAPR